MKITKLETFVCRIAYKHVEASSLINRGGVADVIVKVTADDGTIGWGECTRAADVAGIESAVKAMTPLVIGRDPWDKEAIQRDLLIYAVWQFQAMTGNFAYAGIDMALWDLCGKICKQPLYRLFGGAVREQVDYFYYFGMGHARGYRAPGGRWREAWLSRLLHQSRRRREARGGDARGAARGDRARGPDQDRRKSGLGTAPGSPPAEALNERYTIDFAEAPVRTDPLENMLDLRRQVDVPLCVNEGLWREADAYRVIKSRCADYLCFSPYWVGSMAQFNSLCRTAYLEGWQVCKHTHGELGLAAAAFQHLMLAAPNACLGHQQTAQMMADDILTERIPIMDGPTWGRIDRPGIGVDIDEDKVAKFDADYRLHGEYPTYAGRIPSASQAAS